MVSKKCKYALRAIFELALRNSSDPVKIHDIAASQAIPQRFLEIILAELKHAGFLESRRGNDGGYLLAQPPDKLTVGEIITFFESNSNNSKQNSIDNSARVGNYAFNHLWDIVTTAVSNIYNNTTFADLVRQELEDRKKYVPNYAI